jgi:hypothetical protein
MDLGDLLGGDADWQKATRMNGGVPVLPGWHPSGQADQPDGSAHNQTMDQLAADYDLVVVDVPQLLVGGDCEMLAQPVDTTLSRAKWRATQSC